MQNRSPFLIAIDGRCAAGKTTFAEKDVYKRQESGFPVTPIDFCVNSLIYIVPNLLMICCVYTITALIFKNPLPAAPVLFLHIIYSNMLTEKNDIYYMRPFSIMVRFPGRFFETHAAKMSNINQIMLVIASVILVCISVTIWKLSLIHI